MTDPLFYPADGEGYARTPSDYTVSSHAAERIVYGAPGRSPTTLGRVDDILNNPTRPVMRPDGSIRVFQGKDWVAVRVLQNEAGRFDVVVDGSRGLITSFSNLSQKSLERLATRYGWN